MKRVARAHLAAAVLAAAVGLAGPLAPAHEAHKSGKPAATVPMPSTGPGPLPISAGGPFELTDQTGRPVTDRDFRGRYMLVFFGYANCPGICPTALKAMAEAVDALGGDGDKIAPILITVDPAHDTPESLATAVAKIHPRLIGLTGTPAQVAAAAAAYGVTSKATGRSWQGTELFEHGPFVYLMGPDGKLLTLFPPIIDGPGMATAIRGYLG